MKKSNNPNTLYILGRLLSFHTKPGVFAQYGLDYGSKLLIDSLSLPMRGTILDLGCGCGVLGVSIAAVSPHATVVLVDSDIRAVRLSQENLRLNKVANAQVLISDVVHDLNPTIQFDVVVSNPPTHQGRETLIEFIQGMHHVLQKNGTCYLVVNRMTSTMHLLERYFHSVEKIQRKQGYIVYKSIK